MRIGRPAAADSWGTIDPPRAVQIQAAPLTVMLARAGVCANAIEAVPKVLIVGTRAGCGAKPNAGCDLRPA